MDSAGRIKKLEVVEGEGERPCPAVRTERAVMIKVIVHSITALKSKHHKLGAVEMAPVIRVVSLSLSHIHRFRMKLSENEDGGNAFCKVIGKGTCISHTHTLAVMTKLAACFLSVEISIKNSCKKLWTL